MAQEFKIAERAGLFHLTGPLNERAHFGQLVARKPPLRLELSGIGSANSLGVKQFVLFIQSLKDLELEFHGCSEVMVELFNSFPGALGNPPLPQRVRSFHAPFECEGCGAMFKSHVQTKDVAADPPAFRAPCPKCGNPAEVPGGMDEYTRFLGHG